MTPDLFNNAKPGKLTDSVIQAKKDSFSRAVTVAVLALLPIIYFTPVFLAGLSLMPGDVVQILGERVLIGKMIAAGHVPLWNPYILAGAPLLASFNSGALYLPHWIFAIFSPVTAMNIVVITTYQLALIGSYLYGRRIGMTRLGGIVGGIAFTLGGFMIAQMGTGSRLAAAAWLPWVLLAIERLYQKVSWRWITLGAIFLAMQFFAGDAQIGLFTILICLAHAIFSSFVRTDGADRSRFLRSAISMVVCGTLLSMIQLLPLRELIALAGQKNISDEAFSNPSFPPGQILNLILPHRIGSGAISLSKTAFWEASPFVEIYVYLGLSTLILALIALFARQENKLVLFWAGAVLASLLLAFGENMPYVLNQLFYDIPLELSPRYAPTRHLFVFTFGLSVLAGLGASFIAQMDREKVRSALQVGSLAFISIVILAFLVNYFFAEALQGDRAVSSTNFEALLSISFTVLSLIAVWVYALWRNPLCSMLLVIVLLADVMVFGLAFHRERRESATSVKERLQDPPTVQFIKSREDDLNSFRIISYSAKRRAVSYDLLNFPNLSLTRGLRSVNGVEELRSHWQMGIAGPMEADGAITDPNLFKLSNQVLNLLNVKYFLLEERPLNDHGPKVEIGSIQFNKETFDLNLVPGTHFDIRAPGVMASELALVTAMSESTLIPNDTVVVHIKLHTKDGRVLGQEVRIGRDTAEWTYDRPGVRSIIKHQRAPIAERGPANELPAYQYLARIPFERTEIERIELDYALPHANLQVSRISFYDAATGASTPVGSLDFIPPHWRRLAKFDDVVIYENPRFLPRAWFVKQLAVAQESEILPTIKSGRMVSGSPFDPVETALLASEHYRYPDIKLPAIGEPVNAKVEVSRYEPNRIELNTRNDQPGFIVLSEVYHRGWEARIDGRRTPVELVNSALRGIAVPSGEHRVEFIYLAHSMRNGASYALLGILFLLAGAVATRIGTEKLKLLVPSPARSLLEQARGMVRSSTGWVRGRYYLPSVLLRALSFIRFNSLIIVAVLGLGIYGYQTISCAQYTVSGSDSYGYLSCARLILQGNVVRPVIELAQFDLPAEYNDLFIPLAHVAGKNPKTMVPIYPPGLPLHFVISALLLGWEIGPFIIAPLTAMASLILIYLIGLEFGLSRKLSFAGSVILAVNPTAMYTAMQPMSDGPSMCWALAAIFASLRSKKAAFWAVLAGFSFGVAFLIRPTNILLLLPIFFSLRLTPKILLYFGLGGLPVAAVFFIFNTIAYGHPLMTGYVATKHQDYLMLSIFTERFRAYSYWVSKLMTPFLLMGWLGVVLNREISWRNRGFLFVWFGIFFLFYCFYFPYDEKWYARFLLPGIPALILGSLLTLRYITNILKKFSDKDTHLTLTKITAAALLCVVISAGIHYMLFFEVFKAGQTMILNKESCIWADRIVPQNALIVSKEMSGVLMLYANRQILRFDNVKPEQWEVLKNRAAENGYSFYALLMTHEIPLASEKLPGKWKHLGTYKTHMSLWQIEPGS
jgi:Bacterial membrane protein YfhO